MAAKGLRHTERIQPPPSTASDNTRDLTSESNYGGSYTTLRIPIPNKPVPQGLDDELYPMRTGQPDTFPKYDPDSPMGPFLQLFCESTGIKWPTTETINIFKERLRTVPTESLVSDLGYVLEIDEPDAKFMIFCMLLEGFQT
jgi:hypothetical protein